MPFEPAMDLVTRLMTQAQALSAFAAHLRLVDLGEPAEPALRAQLDRAIDLLDARTVAEDLDARERAILVGFARSYLRQALELMEDPARPGAWSLDDPALLQAQGAASGVIASLFLEGGLGRPDARILDIGTGVGRLAIAFCAAYPESRVVGVDPWEPALRLARQNVAEAGLGSRVTLLSTGVEALEDAEGFDLVWLPSFFIPERVLDDALRTVFRVTRPGATVVIGVPDDSDDTLTAALDDLMTVRSGGTPLSPADAIARLTRAGFGDASEIRRTWRAPVRLVVGRQTVTREGVARPAPQREIVENLFPG